MDHAAVPGPAPAAFLIRDRGPLPDGCRRVARKRERGAKGRPVHVHHVTPNPKARPRSAPFGCERYGDLANRARFRLCARDESRRLRRVVASASACSGGALAPDWPSQEGGTASQARAAVARTRGAAPGRRDPHRSVLTRITGGSSTLIPPRRRQIAKDIGLTMAEFLRRGGDDQSRSVALRMRDGRAGFRVECRSDWLKKNKGWVHRVTQHPKPDSVRLRGEPDAAGRVGRRDMQRVAVGHEMAEERDTARCGRRPLGAAQDLAARIACSSANKRAARSGSRASALVFSSGSISKLKR